LLAPYQVAAAKHHFNGDRRRLKLCLSISSVEKRIRRQERIWKLMQNERLLLSSSLIRRAAIIAVIILGFVAALNIGVKWYGERILQVGHTTATDAVEITIGNDRLKLAKNTLRVPSERHDGERERADLYLTWPDLKGYEDANRAVFDDPAQAAGLIFIQLSQSTMSEDMSGRFTPIYARLTDG
jgi:hypothetical protein